jgi:hypothetical protein
MAATAQADSWLAPRVETYFSRDHHARLTVTPRDLESQLAYFKGKVKNENLAGQQSGSTQTSARGVLERQRADGRWIVVWDRALVNDVAPVSAVVSNSASYVTTFDNWHSMGGGDNVVVIYGTGGALIRSLALPDILPNYYIKALPRTVSSLWWSGEHRISENDEDVILQIVVPSDEMSIFDKKRKFVELPIRLATGEVLTPDTEVWEAALAVGQKIAKLRQEQEEARDKWFREPLTAPTRAGELDWNQYLVEIFFRVDPNWRDGYPHTEVLRDPKARDYAASVGWLREALLDRNVEGDVVMIASPASPETLVKKLTKIVRRAKAGAWKGRRIYVAVPLEFCAPIAALLTPTAAEFVYIDPTKPIPQRPERLKNDGEE